MFLIFPEILCDKPKHSKDMNFIVVALERTLGEFYEACFPDTVLLFQNLSMSEVLHFPGVVHSGAVYSLARAFLHLF